MLRLDLFPPARFCDLVWITILINDRSEQPIEMEALI